MWTDSHCHLDAPEFDADRDAVAARARAAGVTQIVLPAVARGNFETVRQLAHRHGLNYALGIHPLFVERAEDGDLGALRDTLEIAVDVRRRDPRLVAVGEIGLDHFVPGGDLAKQAQAFIGLGFKLGFGGALTFDRALQLRRLAQTLPIEAIVLETDAPDIPPHWLYRSAAERAAGETARNEPGELPRIAQTLAELRGLSLPALAEVTSANVRAALPGLA